jgi:hypothetical protein
VNVLKDTVKSEIRTLSDPAVTPRHAPGHSSHPPGWATDPAGPGITTAVLYSYHCEIIMSLSMNLVRCQF